METNGALVSLPHSHLLKCQRLFLKDRLFECHKNEIGLYEFNIYTYIYIYIYIFNYIVLIHFVYINSYNIFSNFNRDYLACYAHHVLQCSGRLFFLNYC